MTESDTYGHRAKNTPATAKVVSLDGDDDEMFPLLTARDVARKLSVSADYVHNLAAIGELPYVLMPPSGPVRDPDASEGRRRRFRSDHVRQAVEAWTHDRS